MSDDSSDDGRNSGSTADRTALSASAVSSVYKMLGELTADDGVGVLGQNNASSGTPIGVQGAVPNASGGYGLYTTDDAGIEGDIDTNETDFVVEAGTTNTSDARNVVLGHAFNDVLDGAVGGTISGGGWDSGSTARRNRVADDYGTVGGGRENQAGSVDGDPTSAWFATVGGGEGNTASDPYATVGGGENNTAGGYRTTVGGGGSNDITGSLSNATIGGGVGNTIDGASDSFIGGGLNNTNTNGHGGVIGGGWNNSLSGTFASIGGGRYNDASGKFATIGGGGSDDDTLGNNASGEGATVPGGQGNSASGNYSFAAGRNASASHDGAIVFGDSTSSSVSSTLADVALFQHRVDIGDGGQSGVRLMVEGDSVVDDYLLRVRDSGSTKFHVSDNGGTSVGTFTSPPTDGLLIGGDHEVAGDANLSNNRRVGNLGAGAYIDQASNSIPNANWVEVDFDGVRFASSGSFVNDGRFVADQDGRYLVNVKLEWTTSDAWREADWYEVRLQHDGTTVMQKQRSVGIESSQSMREGFSLNRTVSLSTNDEIWVEVLHTAPDSQSLAAGSEISWFEAVHLG